MTTRSWVQLPLGMRARDNREVMSDSTPAPHTHRVTLLIACVAMLLAAYAVWRIDKMGDRVDETNERIARLETANSTVRAEFSAAIERETKARAELQSQWRQLAELPQQVKDLTASYESLRARTERPQRAWNRAEALYLIELAHRRLSFDHDTITAIAALESADTRLASLRDPSLDPVRERLARDLQALRAVPEVDRTGIVSRLLAIESQVGQLPLKGTLVGQRLTASTMSESQSIFHRIWLSITETLDRMFIVRRVDADHGSIVTLEEQSLRREHLALLIYSARNAVLRNDESAYRAALSEASSWLADYFIGDAASGSAAAELESLAKINIAPMLPDISSAAKMLSRVSGTQATP